MPAVQAAWSHNPVAGGAVVGGAALPYRGPLRSGRPAHVASKVNRAVFANASDVVTSGHAVGRRGVRVGGGRRGVVQRHVVAWCSAQSRHRAVGIRRCGGGGVRRQPECSKGWCWQQESPSWKANR